MQRRPSPVLLHQAMLIDAMQRLVSSRLLHRHQPKQINISTLPFGGRRES
ncbi:hypothetical protein HYC85_021640 [Camellia sinensis]|uniref:Uncharacterized protein n=1 Tax=Camellia sinensis TaxID=4442 RepID=A0A7J7GI73_CAMSI|nr:hypothetical protein HYC85_021640 [Camellia sinensis]